MAPPSPGRSLLPGLATNVSNSDEELVSPVKKLYSLAATLGFSSGGADNPAAAAVG